MRVVMVVGRSTGGIGTHAVDLTAGLRELGDQVDIVTDPVTADRFGLPDAHRWWPGRAAGLRGSLRAFWGIRRLATTADVVHAHGHQAGLLAVVATIGLRTPVVVSQHNAVLGSQGLRRVVGDAVQRVVARRASLVTGASSDLVATAADFGARHTELAEVPSPRVPGLLATERLTESGRRALAAELLQENAIESVAPHAPLVLTVARIAPQKDLDTLNEAAALNTEPAGGAPAAIWVVVGGGDDDLRTFLVRRAAALKADVHYVGPQDDLARWLAAAEVFVLPSLWEARALVVQEAMAAGVPVVATDTGGLPDLVQGVGVLVPVNDPSRLAEAVEGLLRDPDARHTASVQGRERAASWDDGTATASRWHEWYSGMLGMT